MHRVLIALLLGLLTISTARAQEDPSGALRITSELAVSEIVLKGPSVSRSSPAPLVLEDPTPGRYDVLLYQGRQRLGRTSLDLGRQVRLREGRGSRTLLSTFLPGLGQWRDYDFLAGLFPLMEVGAPLGRALSFASEANKEREILRSFEAQIPAGQEDEALYRLGREQLEDEVWIEEQTRNDYAILAAYAHVGNILDAAVRRGAHRFELSGVRSVALRYRPPSSFQAGLLSLLYPGLGQTRLGRAGRGRIWGALGIAAGVTLVEAQRYVDQQSLSRRTLQRQIALRQSEGADAADLRLRLAVAEGDLESAKTQRRAVLLGMAGFWLLNVADAVFLADSQPTELENGRIAASAVDVDVAWVGEGPGIVLRGRF